jgi:hypothetical protein
MNKGAEQLRSFLAQTDVPCPSCDYNLRGLLSDRCPECNQKLVLHVTLAEPRQRAFIAAVIALAMGTGFQGLLLSYFLVRMLFDKHMYGEMLRFLVLTAPFFIIEGLALLLLVRERRRFQRRSDSFKGWTIAAACAASISGFLLFTIFIK